MLNGISTALANGSSEGWNRPEGTSIRLKEGNYVHRATHIDSGSPVAERAQLGESLASSLKPDLPQSDYHLLPFIVNNLAVELGRLRRHKGFNEVSIATLPSSRTVYLYLT